MTQLKYILCNKEIKDDISTHNIDTMSIADVMFMFKQGHWVNKGHEIGIYRSTVY